MIGTRSKKARETLAGVCEPCSTAKHEPEHFHMHLNTDQHRGKPADARHIGA